MKRILCVLLLTAVMISSCGTEYKSDTYFALDTFITANLPDIGDVDLYGYIKSLEDTISKTVSKSQISEINKNISYTVTDDIKELIMLSNDVYQKTNGAFDITCGAVSDLWDFKSEDPRIPERSEIEKALENVGSSGISLNGNTLTKSKEGIMLDLGGIGKGYIAEKCVEYLHEKGINSGYLNLGGNIAVVGEKDNGDGWGVALRDPLRLNDTVGRIIMKSGYLSVSGDYERCFEYNGQKYHHILDPKTGYPVNNELSSVAVLSSNGALADALSTALFVMGLDDALSFYQEKKYIFEAIFITKSGYIYTTEGINNSFELTSKNYIMK